MSLVREGFVNSFSVSSKSGLTTIEFEGGCCVEPVGTGNVTVNSVC